MCTQFRSLKLGLKWFLQSPGATVDILRYPNHLQWPGRGSCRTFLLHLFVSSSQKRTSLGHHFYWEKIHTFRGIFLSCCNSGQLSYIYKIFLLTVVARSEFTKHNYKVKNKVISIFWQQYWFEVQREGMPYSRSLYEVTLYKCILNPNGSSQQKILICISQAVHQYKTALLVLLTKHIFTQESYRSYGLGREEAKLDLGFWSKNFPFHSHCIIWQKLF